MDLQLDQLLVGPDVNGDGIRDVFTAAMVDERDDLFAGRDCFVEVETCDGPLRGRFDWARQERTWHANAPN